MPDLVIQFDCLGAETIADEFQHHLLDRKTLHSGAQKETHEEEIWLSYPNIEADTVKRVIQEAHPWCLDRGLSLLQNTNEAPNKTILMIADLTRVLE